MHPFAWGQRVAASIAVRTSITHPVHLFLSGRLAQPLASPTTLGSLWKLDSAKSSRDSILHQLAIFTFRSAFCSMSAKAATEAADAQVQFFQLLSSMCFQPVSREWQVDQYGAYRHRRCVSHQEAVIDQ